MFREGLRPPDPFRSRPAFETLRTQDGMSVKALAGMGDVLLLFVPALGSAPARALVADAARMRERLERAGVRIVLVHMGKEAEARSAFAEHDLDYQARVADPDQRLYDEFEVPRAPRGRLSRLFGTDPVRCAAAFLLRDGRVAEAQRTRSARDVPDLEALAGR